MNIEEHPKIGNRVKSRGAQPHLSKAPAAREVVRTSSLRVRAWHSYRIWIRD